MDYFIEIYLIMNEACYPLVPLHTAECLGLIIFLSVGSHILPLLTEQLQKDDQKQNPHRGLFKSKCDGAVFVGNPFLSSVKQTNLETRTGSISV